MSLFIWNCGAFAASVTKVKDKRVIINLDGMNLNPGDRVYLTQNGKRLAVVTIKQVKNGKALGEVDKGSATEGMAVMQKNGDQGSPQQTSSDSGSSRTSRKKRFRLGVIGGIGMDSQSVTLSNLNATVTETVAMSGMGYGVNFIGDLPLTQLFSALLGAGFETFSVSGTSKNGLCNKSTSSNCSTSINFLALEGWGHLNFAQSFPIFLGLGGEFLVPISSSSNALDPASIATNFAIGGGAGIFFHVGKSTTIPLTLDYMVLPSSSNVSTNTIRLRAGLMF